MATNTAPTSELIAGPRFPRQLPYSKTMVHLVNLQPDHRTLDALIGLVSDVALSLEERQADIECEHLTLQQKQRDLIWRHRIATYTLDQLMQVIRRIREQYAAYGLPNAIIHAGLNPWQALRVRKERELKSYEEEMFRKIWQRLPELRAQIRDITSSIEEARPVFFDLRKKLEAKHRAKDTLLLRNFDLVRAGIVD